MRHSHRLLAVIMGLSVAASATGCVSGAKGVSSEEKERLKAYVLDAEPANIQHRVDFNFDNKVHLIGYKMDPEIAKPGTEAKITYYWRCDDKIEDGWLLFTHLRDEVADANDNLDYAGPIRESRNGGAQQLLGPSKWEKGKFYVDEQPFKVSDKFTGPDFTVYVGIWKGDNRLRVLSGPNDKNRAVVAKVKTGNAPPAPHAAADVLPSLTAVKLAATDKIVIDGKADEKAWGAAAGTGPFVDVSTGKAMPPGAPVGGSAKIMWDSENVYAFFNVSAVEPYTGFTDAKSQPKDFTLTGQPKLWTKDTIELMVDPDGDGDAKDYYEIQINPQGKIFKSQFDEKQKPAGADPDRGPFGHEDWDAKIKAKSLPVMGADGKVAGYTVEAAIPWASFSKAANHPPKPGDTWRMNFYAMRDNSAAAVSWSPILRQGNFHTAQRFGKVTWALTAPVQAPVAAAPAVAIAPATPAPTGASTAVAAVPAPTPPGAPHPAAVSPQKH